MSKPKLIPEPIVIPVSEPMAMPEPEPMAMPEPDPELMREARDKPNSLLLSNFIPVDMPNAVPSTYSPVSPTRQHKHGAYHEATYDYYLAGKRFERQHPEEDLPDLTVLPPWHDNTFYQHNSPSYVELKKDEHIIKFIYTKDKSIQAQYPVPPAIKSEDCFYYEITLLRKKSKDTTVAIGLASRPYPNFRLPGWNKTSVGYHSDDGRKFLSDPTGGCDYAYPYDEGDTVGCGYEPATGTVFYTWNGTFLGVAFSGVFAKALYPTIGADGPCKLEYNFGKKPFKFNVSQRHSLRA
jgi:hypothetical protein